MARRTPRLLQQIRRLAGPSATPAVSDAILLARFVRTRDEDAFAALVGRYGPLVRGVCARILSDVHAAEDAAQATWLVLARKAAHIRPASSLVAWLHGVARRVALTALRSERRRRRHEAEAATRPGVPTTDPLQETTVRELLRIVDEELAALPETQRLPVLLCLLEGKTQEEAARYLGWTPGTVKGRLERGRARLQARLVRRGLTLSAALAVAGTCPLSGKADVLSTVHEALAFAEASATGIAPVRSVSLAEAMLRSMALGKLKLVVAAFLVGSLVAIGATLRFQAAEKPKTRAPAVMDRPMPSRQPHVDHFGDPLPQSAVRLLGTTRFRQDGEVSSLVFSPDGKFLAGRSREAGSVVLWDAKTGRALRQLTGVTGVPDSGTSLAFSPDSKYLAAVSDRSHVGLWELATGTLRITFAIPSFVTRHDTDVHTIRFSPDGRFLGIGGCDNLYVLNGRTGKLIWQFRAGFDIGRYFGTFAFSPDGATVVLDVGQPRGKQKWLEVYDLHNGTLLRRQEEDPATIWDMTFTRDGALLATGGTNGITVWDKAGKLVRRIPTGGVLNLCFTPDGKRLVFAQVDGKVHLRDIATDKDQQVVDVQPGPLRCMALSPDGTTVAVGTVYSTVRLWDLPTGRERSGDQARDHDAEITALAFSPNGRSLVACDLCRAVWLWDVQTGRPMRRLPDEGIRALAWASDGQHMAVLGGNRIYGGGGLRLRDVATGKESLTLVPARFNRANNPNSFVYAGNAIAFSPNGQILVSVKGENDGNGNLNVWSISTGKRSHRFSLPAMLPECVTVGPAGTTAVVAGCSRAAQVRLWDLQRGEETGVFLGHKDMVSCVALSPDGRRLLTSSRDRTTRLWEVATQSQIRTLDTHGYGIAALSPDGRLVACLSYALPQALTVDTYGGNVARVPQWIRLLDAATGTEVQRLQGYFGSVTCLAFSPDGRHLASGQRNGTVLIWDVQSARHAAARRSNRPCSGKELETLWRGLAGSDAAEAYSAIERLSAVPSQAVPLLREHLHPVASVDQEALQRFIRDLDAPKFSVREAATRRLRRLGEAAEPALHQALVGKVSPEVKQRVQALLAQIHVLRPGDRLAAVRAVEVLEDLGTPQAQTLLERLAAGSAAARLTREAKAALGRLSRKTR